MHFNLGVGDKRIQKYINIQKKAVPRCMRMFMVAFYRQCSISTPVDTGRARWGWNCSIGSVIFDIPDSAPNGWVGRSRGGVEYYKEDTMRANNVFTVTAVTGKETLYVANAVPYIGRLNDGYSDQSPARFVELSFETAFQKLDQYIRVRGYAGD